MTEANRNVILALVLAGTVGAQGPQVTVIPATFAVVDANSHVGVAGATDDGRHQTLIGSSHLGGMLGHDISALTLRRSAADEMFQGGAIDLVVRLSTSPNTPLACSRVFSANEGGDAITVFQGTVLVPMSPPQPGPTVSWTPPNEVRIVFQQPFRYQGGTLCVDIAGRVPAQSQAAGWWVADAVFEDIGGQVAQVGFGCGAYGGSLGEWSYISSRSLLAGGHARLWAYGPAGSVAIAAFGALSAQPIPLSALGINSPGCDVHLQPNGIAGSMLAVFEPQANPLLVPRGGVAQLRLRLPNQQWMLGARLTTQWFDLGQLATSNALQWTVAATMPTLDMALVEGHPQDATGEVRVYLAHVLRFEHQAP